MVVCSTFQAALPNSALPVMVSNHAHTGFTGLTYFNVAFSSFGADAVPFNMLSSTAISGSGGTGAYSTLRTSDAPRKVRINVITRKPAMVMIIHTVTCCRRGILKGLLELEFAVRILIEDLDVP
jgi:hypothetical protein